MEVIIILGLIYLAFHAGHARSNYYHGKRMGKRGIGLVWYAGRGPLISIPVPDTRKTRITHRIGR